MIIYDRTENQMLPKSYIKWLRNDNALICGWIAAANLFTSRIYSLFLQHLSAFLFIPYQSNFNLITPFPRYSINYVTFQMNLHKFFISEMWKFIKTNSNGLNPLIFSIWIFFSQISNIHLHAYCIFGITVKRSLVLLFFFTSISRFCQWHPYTDHAG